MIDLTIGNKTYRHPSKIEEVTLKQWVALMSLENDEEEIEFKTTIKEFCAFANIPVDDVMKMSARNKENLLYHIHLVHEMMQEADVNHKEPPKSFKIGRSTYYVPDDIDDCDMAQYIDCTHYMKKMNSSPQFYAYMLSIYCMKKKEKYGDYDIDERAKEMLKCNVKDALTINGFFLSTSEDYLQDSLRYLGEK